MRSEGLLSTPPLGTWPLPELGRKVAPSWEQRDPLRQQHRPLCLRDLASAALSLLQKPRLASYETLVTTDRGAGALSGLRHLHPDARNKIMLTPAWPPAPSPRRPQSLCRSRGARGGLDAGSVPGPLGSSAQPRSLACLRNRPDECRIPELSFPSLHAASTRPPFSGE